MREIKFRGKAVDNGEWIYGYYWANKTATRETYHIVDEFGDMYQVVCETVGQYTGLKDKNGVEIYEGDIIAYADDLAHRMYLESLARSVPNEYYDTVYDEQRKIGLVEYCAESGYPAFDLTGHDSEYNMLSELQIGYITENGEYWYEVIGNIYEHPELLKGES